jgi:hypothetical protein
VVENRFLNRAIELTSNAGDLRKRSESRQFQHTAPFIHLDPRVRDLDRFFPVSREGAASAKLFSGTLNRSAGVGTATSQTCGARNKITAQHKVKDRTDKDYKETREVANYCIDSDASRDQAARTGQERRS